MSGSISTKTSKDKTAEQTQAHSDEREQRPGPSGPQTDILELQQTAGNQAVSQLLESSKEDQGVSTGNDFAEKTSEIPLKPLPSANVSVDDARSLPPRVGSFLKGRAGQPLDLAARAFMESRFGYDFGSVRVHTDSSAAQSAREANAAAYTVGHNIVFGAGRFQPKLLTGRELLAHELAHTIQQRPGGGSQPLIDPSTRQEQSARVVAAAIKSCEKQITTDRGIGLTRQEDVDAKAARTATGYLSPSPILVARKPDESDRPTFGNIPLELPDPRARRVQLVKKGGKWYELRPDGKRWRARGSYDFVIQQGKVWAVKGSRAVGGLNPGHTEAAAGGRVVYAGTMRFGSGKNTRGNLLVWSNASGHYLPAATFAKNAGLPLDKFQPYKGPRPSGSRVQLPVFQPGIAAGPQEGKKAKPATQDAPTRSSGSRAQQALRLGKSTAGIMLDIIPKLTAAIKELGYAYLEQEAINRDFEMNIIPKINAALSGLEPKLDSLRQDTSQPPIFFANIKYTMHYNRYTEMDVTGSPDRSPSISTNFRVMFHHSEFDTVDVSRQDVTDTKKIKDLVYQIAISHPLKFDLTSEEQERLDRYKEEMEKRAKQQLEKNLRQKFEKCMSDEYIQPPAGAEAVTAAHNKVQERCYSKTGYMFWTKKTDQ